jgi:hypothetical protein
VVSADHARGVTASVVAASKRDVAATAWRREDGSAARRQVCLTTGRSFAIAGIDIHAMRDGKMAEHWHVVDLLGLLQQLGVIAQPANPDRSPEPADEAAADSPRSQTAKSP